MSSEATPAIGVLALQGDFAEHVAVLCRLGVVPREVRLPQDLDGLSGLIIPGGESTTIGKLAQRWNLIEPLRTRLAGGWPVWGTCAGLIFLARDVIGALPDQKFLGVMDIRVQRNAFGRQRESFEIDLSVPVVGPSPLHAIFIRAPLIEAVGPAVEVLARLPDGRIVAARQGRLLVTAFHPELTGDRRMHQYFVNLACGASSPPSFPGKGRPEQARGS